MEAPKKYIYIDLLVKRFLRDNNRQLADILLKDDFNSIEIESICEANIVVLHNCHDSAMKVHQEIGRKVYNLKWNKYYDGELVVSVHEPMPIC